MSNISVGMDVHQDAITLAVLPAHAAAPTRVDQLPNEIPKLRRYLDRLAEGGTVLACYDASGAGYVLPRALASWGYACVVIAPSVVPTKPGVQRQHDRYDATQLARLFRAGEVTAGRVPSEVEERLRDLVRCRETIQRELLQSKHYLLKVLARRGVRFLEGKAWTKAHLAWLETLTATARPMRSSYITRPRHSVRRALPVW